MTDPASQFRSTDVSVVINVFNNAVTIGEAIESVLSQTCPPGEVVVIDDGSTDGSGDVARSFGRRVRVLPQPNLGISAARNRGVAEARGMLIASVDADDRWVLTKLERQLPLLVDGVEAVSCHVAQVLNQDWRDVVYEGRAPENVKRGPVWQSLVIRHTAFDRIGGFDPAYRIAEQVDWWTRAADAGLRLVTVPEPLVYRRLHAENHGIRQWAHRSEYARAVHAALRRRRAATESRGGE
jgi:glycosyltransferase involved in cell wall biosynthesis